MSKKQNIIIILGIFIATLVMAPRLVSAAHYEANNVDQLIRRINTANHTPLNNDENSHEIRLMMPLYMLERANHRNIALPAIANRIIIYAERNRAIIDRMINAQALRIFEIEPAGHLILRNVHIIDDEGEAAVAWNMWRQPDRIPEPDGVWEFQPQREPEQDVVWDAPPQNPAPEVDVVWDAPPGVEQDTADVDEEDIPGLGRERDKWELEEAVNEGDVEEEQEGWVAWEDVEVTPNTDGPTVDTLPIHETSEQGPDAPDVTGPVYEGLPPQAPSGSVELMLEGGGGCSLIQSGQDQSNGLFGLFILMSMCLLMRRMTIKGSRN